MNPPDDSAARAGGRTPSLEERLTAADRRVHSLEERHRALIENLPDVIWTADANGRAVYITARIEEVFGFTRDEVYAKGEELWLGRIHPDHVERVWQAYQGLFGEPKQLFDVLYLYQHKDGRWVWIHDRALTTWESDGVAYADGILSDVTALKHLEDQLRQSQKMEAVGRLSAGIAHDFNNLLTAILGYSDLVLDDLGPKHPARTQMEEIQRAARRAAALTQELLAFSRKQVLQPSVIDLGSLVDDMTGMLQRVAGEHIRMTVRRAPHEVCVRADRSRIEQVVLNLVVNARDAMPEGGHLTIATAYVGGGDRSRPAQLAEGAYAVLTVADTGIGMDERTRARIFEPFFTTKDIGKGTGLGLASVYGIVKQSGGHIEVTSAPGQGTSFRVYLPMVQISDAAEPPR
jgi:two-component system, cell cycle sensor histidine kinase and response regulator CckA